MGYTEISFFFVFLPISILLYLLIDKYVSSTKAKNIVLVLMSLLFYYWASKKTFVVFISIVVFTYLSGWAVKNMNKEKKTISFCIICLASILLFFKYGSFFSSWINNIAEKNIISMGDIVVPIGISFVCFEAISYVTDIYRGDAPAGSFLDCLTFLSLFPKLVSGPIVLWKDIYNQIHERKTNLNNVSRGLERIIVGYAKKVIIADSLALQISLINNGISRGGVDIPTIWLKAIYIFFQIYFDFSGYSDIAIGLLSIFGFSVKENFVHPYLSRSISEFWRRWHISLGTWFREYIYIPLGGNREGNVYLHLVIVFLLTGIWHGSGWLFLIWGSIHGLCVVIERIIQDKQWYKGTPECVRWATTMCIVFLTWILFMSPNLTEAMHTFAGMIRSETNEGITFTWIYYLNNRSIILPNMSSDFPFK